MILTNKDTVGKLIDLHELNICPRCKQTFLILSLIPRISHFDVYQIDESVHCPDCCPKSGGGGVDPTVYEELYFDEIKKQYTKIGPPPQERK